jgi:hypothetical protein
LPLDDLPVDDLVPAALLVVGDFLPPAALAARTVVVVAVSFDVGVGVAPPFAESPWGAGGGVDITSPVRVTTTSCTSFVVAPAAGIVNAFASSGVTDFTS